MIINIDAGHGPETAGKRSPDGSLREYQFNSVVAKYVADLLWQYQDVAVAYTHEDGRDVPLRERTDRANSLKADLLVSIHANAAGDGWSPASGIETFVHTSWPAPAVALANAVQRHLIRATGRVDRGVKAGNLHMLRESKMTAILVECGFMTNKQECELLKSDAYRRKCAQAIVAGIVECYGLKRKEAAQPNAVIVNVNGNRVQDGLLIDGLTYVPVRVIAESLGASVAWDGKTRTVNITKK